ncbi:White collar 1 protein [Metarhizium anisopliae]|nr:White collar 1 protein [Metarhizium anisopliae]
MASHVDLVMNPWEAKALDYHYPAETLPPATGRPSTVSRGPWQAMSKSVFYPGLYSATGFDIMGILTSLMARPNPQVEIGKLDCSVALVLCNLEEPDDPIVYASDAFCALTGYSQAEVIGKNCRFLQQPHPSSWDMSKSTPKHDKHAASKMRHALQAEQEIELRVINYRKDGRRFINRVSIVPVTLNGSGYRYAVGLLKDDS